MRWTLWRGMVHTSEFGCSVFLFSPSPCPCKPQAQTLPRASWGPTEVPRAGRDPPGCW